jgi:hypothetical protein
MTSRQPKSEEGVLQPPRRTPFVYLVHENSMNMPTAILHPRTAAMVASPELRSMAAARRDVAGGTRLAQVSAAAYIYARAPPKQRALAQK